MPSVAIPKPGAIPPETWRGSGIQRSGQGRRTRVVEDRLALAPDVPFFTQVLQIGVDGVAFDAQGLGIIFMVVEEAIPGSQPSGHGNVATFGVMVGFTAMMVLGVALE